MHFMIKKRFYSISYYSIDKFSDQIYYTMKNYDINVSQAHSFCSKDIFKTVAGIVKSENVN